MRLSQTKCEKKSIGFSLKNWPSKNVLSIGFEAWGVVFRVYKSNVVRCTMHVVRISSDCVKCQKKTLFEDSIRIFMNIFDYTTNIKPQIILCIIRLFISIADQTKYS